MSNAGSMILASMGVVGILTGLQQIVTQLHPVLNVTYYPLELNTTTAKATLFLTFGLIATIIAVLGEMRAHQEAHP